MNKIFLCLIGLTLCMASSCVEYNRITKTSDYQYKYEAAKQYYAEGMYNRAALLLNDVITALKGTDQGEESLYLTALANMKAHSYEVAASVFKKYYQTYPKGTYVEEARYNCGYCKYLLTPEPRLDQTTTFEAVTEFQNFIEYYPTSRLRPQAQEMIFILQDKLVEKEYLSAKLYYDLGAYIGNGTNGNYDACIVTAENAIQDYPYMSRREDFSLLILKAKFALADLSIEMRKEERFHNAIDEYYAFVTEFPESEHMEEVQALYASAKKYVSKEDADEDVSAPGKAEQLRQRGQFNQQLGTLKNR